MESAGIESACKVDSRQVRNARVRKAHVIARDNGQAKGMQRYDTQRFAVRTSHVPTRDIQQCRSV